MNATPLAAALSSLACAASSEFGRETAEFESPGRWLLGGVKTVVPLRSIAAPLLSRDNDMKPHISGKR